MMTRVLLVLVFLLCSAKCQIKKQLHSHINQMITGPIAADHLVNWNMNFGQEFSKNIKVSQLADTVKQSQSIKNINLPVLPFAKLKSLLFGSKSKFKALLFTNQINANGAGRIIANAIIGSRNGDDIEFVSAYGVVQITAKQQFNSQKVRKCKRFLFFKRCHDETVRTPRGFFNNELEAIVKEAERRAAVAMRQSLGFGSSGPELTRIQLMASSFQNEHNQLRKLYPEIEYLYSDSNDNDLSQWNAVLNEALSGRADQDIRNRINQLLNSHSYSNFLYAATDKHLYYLILQKNSNNTFNLHVSMFIVGASGRLPTGAFCTSVGQWKLERAGQGANPSIHQVMAIFGYNK